MENLLETIRVGIIGAGHIGAVHCRHTALIPGISVTAIADSHHEKAQMLAATVDAETFSSSDALLQTDVDAVIVAVPTAQHRAIVEMALAAGKHVFCEKPLTLTLADCDILITASEIAQKILTVGQVARFFPEYANAKRLIDSGAIGTPAAARTRRASRYPATPWFADETQSGGILLDLLIHDFDFLQWCFGPVIRVHARTLTEKKLAGLDYALVTLRHASGVISHVEGIWGEPNGFHSTFEFAGDGGLLVHDSHQTPTIQRSMLEAARTGGSGPLAYHDDPYFRQLSAFVEAVRTSGIPPVTANEARQAIAVALAAQQSAKTGQAVTLNEGAK